MEIKWIDGFTIKTAATSNEILICANKEGLLSLAEICKSLAMCEDCTHIHLDEYNSLEGGSLELIISKEKHYEFR